MAVVVGELVADDESRLGDQWFRQGKRPIGDERRREGGGSCLHGGARVVLELGLRGSRF